MAKVLVQTTITDVHIDWNIGRLSLVAEELRRIARQVTARNRYPGDDDPILNAVDRLNYDQLWLVLLYASTRRTRCLP